MNSARASRQIWRRCASSRRTGQVSWQRTYAEPASPHPPSSPPNPNSPPKEPSRVGAYYKTFSYPILKSFLIALFTYQIAYYGWLKLEMIEEAHDKKSEISDLQRQLKEAVIQQKYAAQDKMNQAVDAAGEIKDIAVESVKEGVDEAKKATNAVGNVAKGGWWPW